MQEVEAICDRVIIISKGKTLWQMTNSATCKNSNSKHIVAVWNCATINADHLKPEDVSKTEQLSVAAFQFTTEKPDNVRKQLMELSLQNNWNIVSLQSEKKS